MKPIYAQTALMDTIKEKQGSLLAHITNSIKQKQSNGPRQRGDYSARNGMLHGS